MTEPASGPDPWSRPTYGQPTFSQPAPAQPIYPPPAAYPPPGSYAPPGAYPSPGAYQQPTYQQPAYPPTGPLYYDPALLGSIPPQPKRMSGGVKALLWAIPIVVVLALVGIGFAIGSTSSAVHNIAANGGSGADTFTMPATAIGLNRTDPPTLNSIIDPMKRELNGRGTVTAAFYSSDADPQSVLIIMGVATSRAVDAANFQTGVLGGLGLSMNGTNGKNYPAGPMGGTLKCEDGGKQSLKIGFCAVADHGGALVLIYFDHSGAETAAAMLQLRPTVEKQG